MPPDDDDAKLVKLAEIGELHQAVVARARGIYLGTEEERWDDLQGRLLPFAEAVVAEVEAEALRRRNRP